MGGDLTLYIVGDPIPGYLATADGAGPFPGVVVLHQAHGLDDDIRRLTDRVASLGYLAVAPDLVAGRGWRCIAGLFRDLLRGRGEGVETAEAVIASADAGLYKAKRSGRNEIVLASGDDARAQR